MMDANRLNQWRRDLGLSQSQMARYLKIPVTTWRHWESGRRTPGSASQALCRLLEVVRNESPALHDSMMDQVLRGGSW